VLVYPGRYAGPVHIDKSLEVVGYGPVGSIIVSANEGPSVIMTGGGATLRNITIRQEADDSHTDAVQLLAGGGWLGGCDVNSRGVGVRDSSDGAWTVQGCRVHECGDAGVIVHGSPRFVLEDCDLVDNRASGIHLSLNSDGRFGVRLSRLSRNGTFGLSLERGDGYVEYTEIIENGQAGIHIEGTDSSAGITQNQVRGNRGSGVEAVARGRVYSRDNVITQNLGAGLLLEGEGTMATTRDDRFDGNEGGSAVTRGGAILKPS
jgi:Right handed beta helix region